MAYVLRFAVNVLIEPQINPIKHFPVVTVGHKLLLAAYEPFADLLEASLGMGEFAGMGRRRGNHLVHSGHFRLPGLGVEGELAAVRGQPPADLRPVMIGSHGETMARLLKPGFHSGTLPKRYAKLRLAERHARAGGNWRAVHKHLRALRHVELSIRRCVEREFLELFAESNCWQAPPVTLERIRLGTNSVRLSLACPADGRCAACRSRSTSQSGWLLAGVSGPGWIDRLMPQQRQVLVTAILGLYKSAGVDLVRQQIESEFSPPVPWYDVSPRVVVWPDEQRRRGGLLRSS